MNIAKLEKHGFKFDNGEWSKSIDFREYPWYQLNNSQAHLKIDPDDGKLSVELEFTYRDDGVDVDMTIVIPLDELWELIEAGVIKKGR